MCFGNFLRLSAAVLLLVPSVAFGQTNSITDPAGNVWAFDSVGWHYWTGFGVGCTFMLFAFVKRMGRKVVSGSSDF